jgi:hypothetical protein
MATTRFPKDTANIQHKVETFFLLKPNKSSHEGTHPCQKQLSKRPPKWMPESGRRFSKTFKHTTPEAPSKASDEEFRRAMCEKGGRRFSPTFPSHTTHRVPTLLTTPKDTGDVFPSRTTKHLEGCTHKAPRRMHTTKHLEGCTS